MIFPKNLCSTRYRTSLVNILTKQGKKYHISVEPQSCLQDVPVLIKATGLKPNEMATIIARTNDDKGEEFFSYAYYKANHNGCIDLHHHISQGGAYKGCLPMGLLSSLRHVNPGKGYLSFIKKHAENSLKLTFSLLPGHLDRDKCIASSSEDYLTSSFHERHYMAEGCRKVIVKEGQLRGSLFLPPGPGPFPGIVDLYGSNGGLKETRAAQFASNGIAAFSLAYFRYDDLPPQPKELDMAYFENAVHYLLQQKEILPNGVGTIGISKGADIALAMAVYIKEVKAVVFINGIPANTLWPLKTKNGFIPPLLSDTSKVKFKDDMVITLDSFNDSADFPETIFPIEKTDAQLLFIVGNDDPSWHTVREVRRAADRMRSHGRSNFEVVEYEDAGHLIEPPFSRFVECIYHNLFKAKFYMGGQLNKHSRAEQLAWPKIIKFFKNNLSAD